MVGSVNDGFCGEVLIEGKLFGIFQAHSSLANADRGNVLAIVSCSFIPVLRANFEHNVLNLKCLFDSCSWLCCYMCQMNPLIGPIIGKHTALVMQREWVRCYGKNMMKHMYSPPYSDELRKHVNDINISIIRVLVLLTP